MQSYIQYLSIYIKHTVWLNVTLPHPCPPSPHTPLPLPSPTPQRKYIYIIYIVCIFLVGAAGIYEFNYYAIPIGG